MADWFLPSPFRYCEAPIAYLNRPLEPVQPLCIAEHIACLMLEGEACYVKRTRLAKCLQANKRWTGSDANNL